MRLTQGDQVLLVNAYPGTSKTPIRGVYVHYVPGKQQHVVTHTGLCYSACMLHTFVSSNYPSYRIVAVTSAGANIDEAENAVLRNLTDPGGGGPWRLNAVLTGDY